MYSLRIVRALTSPSRTFGMSEEELSELMGMERDSEKVDELVRRIFEREGWEYEED